MTVTSKYGPWGVVAGGSDGVGAAFARGMASRGINVVLVARRVPVLEASADDIRARYGVEVATVPLDLSAPGALQELADATSDLEIGLFVYNAGGDDRSAAFLGKDLATHLELVRRNCAERARGGLPVRCSDGGAGARGRGACDVGRGLGRRRHPRHLRSHEGIRPDPGGKPVGGVARQRRGRPRARARQDRYPFLPPGLRR